LLFQRDLVEEKLDSGKQTGRDYLQKIIQVPFDIPKIEPTRVQNLLFKEIENILEQDSSAVDMFDSGYWGNLFHGSLHMYFDNLRNVYRFSSTLSFHFSLLRGKRVFEVNPVDLIAIECLRFFEPDIYQEIARSKDVFTGHNAAKRSNKVVIEHILESSTNGKEKYVKELVEQIFPNTTSQYGEDFYKEWLREMRVYHPSNFDKYFQFTIPSGKLSNSDLLKMLELAANSENFIAFINSLKERNILRNALSKFESYIEKIPLENAAPFIRAILDVGYSVDHDTSGFAMTSSNLHLVRLVIWFLKRNEDIASRSQLLLKCFKESNGLSIVESILQGDENRREKPREPLFCQTVSLRN